MAKTIGLEENLKKDVAKRPRATNDDTQQPNKKKSKVAGKYQTTKCRPKNLVELIKVLNDEQKNVVRNIGFGGLLELKLNKIPHGIMQLLIDAFDYASHMFQTKKWDFLLTKHDVHDIFKLPRDGVDVPLVKTKYTDNETDQELKNAWRVKFGVTGTSNPILLSDVHTRLKGTNDAGDEFKKMFVMYCMSNFLAPTSNKTLDLRLVKAVENVKNIRNFDWCTYVFKEMVESIKLCKQDKKSTVSGCIVVLMLAYFHRFDFKGKPMPHTLPLIKHWDDEKLLKRVEDEKQTGTLGIAPKSKIEYPISQKKEEDMELRFTQTSDTQDEMEEKEGYMMVKLPEGVETDKQIKERAIDGGHEIYLRMKRDNKWFIARYSHNVRKLIKVKLIKPTDEPTLAAQVVAGKEGGEGDEATKKADNSEKGASEDQNTDTPKTQTLPFMRDPDYHAFIDGLIARSYEREKQKKGLPSFDIWTDMLKMQYKELNKEYGGCTDKDLMSSGDELDCGKEQQEEKNDTVTNLSSGNDDSEGDETDNNDLYTNLNDVVDNICEGVKVSFEEKTNEQSNVNAENQEEKEKEAEAMNLNEMLKGVKGIVAYLLHSDVVPETAKMLPCNLGCSLELGLPYAEAELVSKFMLEHEQMVACVSLICREVMDYCFLDDHTIKHSEIVCNFGKYHEIRKSDIESLLPNTRIEAVIIESWAILLNEFEMTQKDNNRPTRVFFGLAHSNDMEKLMNADVEEVDEYNKIKEAVYKTWDKWVTLYKKPLNVNSNMVFIPLLYEDHYNCICIDFKREKLFFLDNRVYKDFDDTDQLHMAVVAATTYIDYLISKGNANISKAHDYNLANVPFVWKTDKPNLDCGLFMMFHMLFFFGDEFMCNLDCEDVRPLYRAEIAATLVVSDLNKNKDEVLIKIEDLIVVKNTLLPKLIETRKKREQQEKKNSRGGKANVQTPVSKVSKKEGVDGSASVVGSKRRGKSDGLGSTYNCGVANAKIELISRFMRANKSLCEKMLTMRKEVLDYCLLDDHIFPLEEVVAVFSARSYLLRSDILSLLPDVHVNDVVIDCWALILNYIEHTEKCSTSLMFFGIWKMQPEVDEGTTDITKEQAVFKKWDNFVSLNTVPCNLEADLVFVPMVLEDHYFCVCVNFIAETIDVLDNTAYNNWSETGVYKAARLVVRYMSAYLDEKIVNGAQRILDYEIVNMDFPWQTKEANNTESGNFLMLHMIRYEGKLFEADLTYKKYRRYYWAEIAAALVLADINEIRTPLIKKVEAFTVEKKQLVKNLLDQRKIKEVAQKKGGSRTSRRNAVDNEIIVEKVPKKVKIDTEIPILRQSPRIRDLKLKDDGEVDGLPVEKRAVRVKTVARHKSK